MSYLGNICHTIMINTCSDCNVIVWGGAEQGGREEGRGVRYCYLASTTDGAFEWRYGIVKGAYVNKATAVLSHATWFIFYLPFILYISSFSFFNVCKSGVVKVFDTCLKQGWGQVQLVKYSNTSSTRNQVQVQVQVQVLCIFTNQVLKYIKY